MNAPPPVDVERLIWDYEAARRIIHGLLVAIDGGLVTDVRRECENARAFMKSSAPPRRRPEGNE